MHLSTRKTHDGHTCVVTVAIERKLPCNYGTVEEELGEIGESNLYFLDPDELTQFIDDEGLTRMTQTDEQGYYEGVPVDLRQAFRSRLGARCIRGLNNSVFCNDSDAYIKHNTVSGIMTKSKFVAVAVAVGEVNFL